MTIAFPLARTAFADLLPIASFKWHLPPLVESSGTALGQVITNEIAPRRWRAEAEIGRMKHAEAAEILALFDAIGPNGTFYLHNPAQPGPRDDPKGVVLGASSVTIDTIGGDNKSLRLAGLPAGYTLKRGDLLHFDYASNPTRRALHRMVENATANASGVTGSFEIRPFVRAGTTTGLAVTLIKPAAKMIVEPGSFDPGTAGPVFVTGMSFRTIEVR